MDGLLPQAALDGLAVAISPVPVIGAIGLLSTRRPLTNSLSFLLGWVSHLASMSILFLIVLRWHSSWGNIDLSRPIAILLLGTGILLLVLAVPTWLRRGHRADELGYWLRRLDTLTPRLAFVVGFLALSLNAKNSALTLSLVHGLVSGHRSAGTSTLLLGTFILLATLTVAAPVALHLALPGRSGPLLEAWHGWLNRHSRAIVAWGLLAVGSLLTVSSLLVLRG